MSGDPGADGMRGHPPPGAVGGQVHALLKGPNMARGGVNSLLKNLQTN